jgi:hypothetical protein
VVIVRDRSYFSDRELACAGLGARLGRELMQKTKQEPSLKAGPRVNQDQSKDHSKMPA